MRLLLAVVLFAYIVLDVLLTPVAGFETRGPAKVHVIGLAGLALLFVGLALSIVAIVPSVSQVATRSDVRDRGRSAVLPGFSD